jgi:hypothetical protein
VYFEYFVVHNSALRTARPSDSAELAEVSDFRTQKPHRKVCPSGRTALIRPEFNHLRRVPYTIHPLCALCVLLWPISPRSFVSLFFNLLPCAPSPSSPRLRVSAPPRLRASASPRLRVSAVNAFPIRLSKNPAPTGRCAVRHAPNDSTFWLFIPQLQILPTNRQPRHYHTPIPSSNRQPEMTQKCGIVSKAGKPNGFAITQPRVGPIPRGPTLGSNPQTHQPRRRLNQIRLTARIICPMCRSHFRPAAPYHPLHQLRPCPRAVAQPSNLSKYVFKLKTPNR